MITRIALHKEIAERAKNGWMEERMAEWIKGIWTREREHVCAFAKEKSENIQNAHCYAMLVSPLLLLLLSVAYCVRVCIFGKRLIHSFSMFFFLLLHSHFWAGIVVVFASIVAIFTIEKVFLAVLHALIWESSAHTNTRTLQMARATTEIERKKNPQMELKIPKEFLSLTRLQIKCTHISTTAKISDTKMESPNERKQKWNWKWK